MLIGVSGATLRVAATRPIQIRSSLAMSALLPGHAISEALKMSTATTAPLIAIGSGMGALALQFLLQRIFARSSDPALSRNPGYVAHNVIAFGFMLICTFVGGLVWLTPSCWPHTAAARLLEPSSSAVFIAAMIFGELLFWDVPCGFLIPKLRRPDMILHHIGFLVPTFTAMLHAPIYYSNFYFGLSEASTMPLILNEMFAHAHDAVKAAEPTPTSPADDGARLARLARRRDAFQVVAALLFVALRGVGFTFVTFARLLPDTLQVLRTLPAAATAMTLPLKLHVGFAMGFNALQLYWLSELIKFMVTNGPGGQRPD